MMTSDDLIPAVPAGSADLSYSMALLLSLGRVTVARRRTTIGAPRLAASCISYFACWHEADVLASPVNIRFHENRHAAAA